MSRYISHISSKLKRELPSIVTKEELMNHYIHVMNFNGPIAAETTVADLVAAAYLANIQVKGHSPLEINVTLKEQWEFIKNCTANLDQEGFKAMMFANKEDIIKSYKSGATTKDLAKKHNCSVQTLNRYLKMFGVKLRKPGKRKILGTREVPIYHMNTA